MNMTSEEKKVNIRLARRRYAELHSKREKGEFLDQFCAMTVMPTHRHAMNAWRHSQRTRMLR